ncbi:methyltransferase [Azospirillum thiophilum]|uniref:Methyltransferase n=1 Tax=Azospirillum thiophilum TaxID=528244 RepID=A0AAC8VYC3_9PROT|nr:tetratricopeptide repeat protein [Azospirillum thiophilum]ALG71481.1 methyltransferase [Azospirillum thiophilum]KJR64872.1 methyltransferase [Azospirillum thiophilum]
MPADPSFGEASPASPSDQLFRYGYDRLYGGDFTAAADGFRRTAAIVPDNGEAWAALADANGGSGALGRSAAAWRCAVTLEPGNWTWRLMLAEALRQCGEIPAALAFHTQLVAERSDSAQARLGLARCLTALGRMDEALDEFREAVALRPDDRDAVLALAEALTACGDALAAVELLQPLAHRFEDDAAVHHALGRGWLALREPAKALAALRRARDGAEGDEAAAIERLVAALEAGEGADLSAAYVRALFDRYADRFDQDLVGKLGYAAPELLRGAVDRVLPEAAGLRILDLGCGTGLAGVSFKPLAGHLAGVDLSPRMVEKARQRGLYDELGVGDVVEAMERTPGAWDLLVAADVLVYIGDLVPVFAAAASALPPGGLFAATVERLPTESAEPFALGATRRYAHAETYVRAAAVTAGFSVRLIEPCTPRREKGVPVDGLLFVMERASL